MSICKKSCLPTFAVDFFHSLKIFHREIFGFGRVWNEECVVCVSSGMLLGLKKGVKVPEAAFHEVVGRHLRETHLQEDLPEFRANLRASEGL